MNFLHKALIIYVVLGLIIYLPLMVMAYRRLPESKKLNTARRWKFYFYVVTRFIFWPVWMFLTIGKSEWNGKY